MKKTFKILCYSIICLAVSTTAFAASNEPAWQPYKTANCKSNNCRYIMSKRYIESLPYSVQSSNKKLLSDVMCQRQTPKVIVYDMQDHVFLKNGAPIKGMYLTRGTFFQKIAQNTTMDLRKSILRYKIKGKIVNQPTYIFSTVDYSNNVGSSIWVNKYCRFKTVSILTGKPS